jgi:hypothetical protein
MFFTKAGERVDYGGLPADWREMTVCADSTFAAIKEALAPGKIAAVEDYRLAVKKLVIRGETLVIALREAYEAHTKYLLLEVEKKVRDGALKEIDTLYKKGFAVNTEEAIAFMYVKHQLTTALTPRRRVVFNMLHEGVLALVYQSNNVKIQKQHFGSLSPALGAADLADPWAKFTKMAGNYYQLQSADVRITAAEMFPLGWEDLLVSDLETPFQIPPTLPKLSDMYHMRIRSLCVEFIGLNRSDGTTTGLEELEYMIWLGPLMYDRASSDDNKPSSQATMVQYYMDRTPLKKRGINNAIEGRSACICEKSIVLYGEGIVQAKCGG